MAARMEPRTDRSSTEETYPGNNDPVEGKRTPRGGTRPPASPGRSSITGGGAEGKTGPAAPSPGRGEELSNLRRETRRDMAGTPAAHDTAPGPNPQPAESDPAAPGPPPRFMGTSLRSQGIPRRRGGTVPTGSSAHMARAQQPRSLKKPFKVPGRICCWRGKRRRKGRKTRMKPRRGMGGPGAETSQAAF